MHHTKTKTRPTAQQRKGANRELLAHYCFHSTVARERQCELEQHASPMLRAALPLLPVIYGRRRNRFDHARRQLSIPVRRLALELSRR
jgi:hypothetical protein